MSTTQAVPKPLHSYQKMTTQHRHRAILGSFPNQRHVEFYKAEKLRKQNASQEVHVPSSVGAATKNPIPDVRELVSAVVQILSQLKAKGLLSRQSPKGLSQWLEALSDIKNSRERRDSLGRTPADVQTIFRSSARFGQR